MDKIEISKFIDKTISKTKSHELIGKHSPLMSP